jgi:hypothetical protein
MHQGDTLANHHCDRQAAAPGHDEPHDGPTRSSVNRRHVLRLSAGQKVCAECAAECKGCWTKRLLSCCYGGYLVRIVSTARTTQKHSGVKVWTGPPPVTDHACTCRTSTQFRCRCLIDWPSMACTRSASRNANKCLPQLRKLLQLAFVSYSLR